MQVGKAITTPHIPSEKRRMGSTRDYRFTEIKDTVARIPGLSLVFGESGSGSGSGLLVDVDGFTTFGVKIWQPEVPLVPYTPCTLYIPLYPVYAYLKKLYTPPINPL